MRRKSFLKMLVLTFLFSLLLSGYSQPGVAANTVRDTVRIGLFYGNNTLAAANLLNYEGSGYQFGYFDGNLDFVPIGETDIEAITMLKDWNMYLQDGTYYDERPSAYSGVVGCYHIRLPGTYSSYTEASSAASNYSGAFVGYFNGSISVCVGSYTSYSEAESDMYARGLSGEVMTGSAYCVTVVETGTTNILFEFDGGSSSSLGVMPKQSGNAKPETWFKYYRYYGGFRYERLTGGNMTVVNILDLEDYVKGVVPYEMSTSWPVEALKAQALSARTYAATHFNNHKSYGFDLCNSTCCQAYMGTSGAGTNSDLAVDATAGRFIWYDGELCQTFYSSSDGGATENSENVFYDALPYLRGVIDPHEEGINTGYSNWSFTYTTDEITWILQNKGYNCAQIVSVTPTYTAVGNVYSLKFTDSNGKNFTFSRYDAQNILCSDTLGKYTYSQRFTITSGSGGGTTTSLYVNGSPVADATGLYAIDGDGTVRALGNFDTITVLTGSGTETVSAASSGGTLSGDTYTVRGSGWGHNVGMSQYGAYGMAKKGYTYDQIIKFYYTGVTIE